MYKGFIFLLEMQTALLHTVYILQTVYIVNAFEPVFKESIFLLNLTIVP